MKRWRITITHPRPLRGEPLSFEIDSDEQPDIQVAVVANPQPTAFDDPLRRIERWQLLGYIELEDA